MKKFGRFIAKNRILVVIISILLMFPALYGMISTRINYDLLTYLPQNLDSMKGQEILDKKYSDAATSMLIIEDMEPKDIVKIKEKVSKVEGVNKVIWIDDVLDTTIPKEILPDDARKSFYSGNSTMLIIKFNESPSSENTQQAIRDIRKLTNKQCFLSGMSAIVKDTKDLADKETPFYVLLAVVFSVIVLSLTMKSVIIPFIFLAAIGLAILYNFGTNIFFGQISYVTKALAAVLQLGVTMDYSIFLLHRYDEEREKLEDKNEAMADAIANTIVSITGSSLTTIAGFLALCVMTLALGKDIGIVMAKGVVLGVISTVTVLPALILIFDKPIHKFSHKTVLPEFNKVANLVTKKYKAFIALFLLLFIPAVYGNNHTKVYYNLDESLPKDMESIVATNKLKKEYNMTTTHFILVNDKLEGYKVKEMVDKLEKVDGIEKVLSYDKFIGSSIPESFIPKDIRDIFKQGGYNLILANSKYKAARDEENAQIDEVNKIVKSYDKGAMVAGEGPLTKDLIEIADKDFKHVSVVSIAAIFAIILILFKSISIPILLVSAIELAIFINMGIPFYTGTTIPFIASIVIGCIQLGATVDYAILMTTRFREEIRNGYDRFEAATITVKGTAKSIVTSGLTFFAATASVGIVSNMDLIKTLCGMIARGALISMGVILFILPSILIVCEKFINATTIKWKSGQQQKLDEKTA
ncbi:efflux RND transporter permease subunit [Haloimpatiens lingqiaonensis]|uniref:efflux RND transporter permease subunit n=1 Tax=Haloimpatiens lingqiaonensis TaxID=1380675 RepID=UPI0010FDF855|nr:MMPL family transporter [Haloimpatiens lingqiaonensis]